MKLQWSTCGLLGILLWLCQLMGRAMAGGIEIVEEQSCEDQEFRLTCRDLNTHIAILEAWFTSLDNFPFTVAPSKPSVDSAILSRPSDQTLNQIHVYSSPQHNGFYQEERPTPIMNQTDFNYYSESNETEVNKTEIMDKSENVSNETETNSNKMNNILNDIVNNSNTTRSGVAGGREIKVFSNKKTTSVNATDCPVPRFQISYASGRASENVREGAWFSPNISVNLRSPLRYRCTGVNHCSFRLPADHKAAATWGRGAVYIKYACFDEEHATRFCNREVEAAGTGPASEGYVRTPGYPNYYVGEAQCLWQLRAPPGQRIRLTLVDVSLRSIGPFEDRCTDYVSVWDAGTGLELLSTCDQSDVALALESQTNAVNVLIETHSEGAYPKRGVLMHYKSVGCVTQAAPPDGYLVYREPRVALYMCDVHLVFPDSRQRARAVGCVDDNRWNDTVPQCIEDTASPAGANNSFNESTEEPKLPSNDNNMIVDIVIPSLLIAALFIGNAFIVLIIYKYRKRKTDDMEDEFNTIPLSLNGSAVHTAGNAV